MKDIYSIIILVVVCFLVFFGVSLIGQQAFINGNLDQESINALALYDSQLDNFNRNLTAVTDDSQAIEDYQPDANLINEYIQEYSEAKDRVTQFFDAAKLIYKLPDILVLSIPFVEESDITVYRNMLWFIISITLAAIFFNAIARREVTKQ